MSVEKGQLEGFDAGDRALPVPVVDVSEQVRYRLAQVLMAVVGHATPEEVAGYLEDGFPPEIEAALDRPGERDEIVAHVDIMLAVLQSPVSETV